MQYNNLAVTLDSEELLSYTDKRRVNRPRLSASYHNAHMTAPRAKENLLIFNMHDYCMADKPVITLVDSEFPPLPITPAITPSKPPVAKKLKSLRSLDMDDPGIVQKIASILDARLNILE